MGKIATHPIGNSSLNLTPLQFVDDTLLFTTIDSPVVDNLFYIIKVFEQASGLNINYGKSELLGINVDDVEIEALVSKFGCKHYNWPTTYLGLPLGGNPKLPSFWNSVIERTLIHATLSSMLIYHLSLFKFKLPSKVAKSLDKLIRDFFWEGSTGEGGSYNINWPKTQLPHIMEVLVLVISNSEIMHS